jgi:hypothetical protein
MARRKQYITGFGGGNSGGKKRLRSTARRWKDSPKMGLKEIE